MNQAAPAPRLTLDDVAAMIQRGDLDGARAQCERYFAAVDAAALRAPFHFYLGVIEQRGGNLEAGIKHFELALAQNRRNPAWLRQAASAHVSAHSIERAEHLYREALRIDPRDALSHYNFGILLQHKANWQGARRAFEAAIAHRPHFAEALVNLGNTLIELGESDSVEGCYRRALDINPQLVPALQGLGLVLSGRGIHAAAARAYEAIVEIDPSHVDAWLLLLDCRLAVGDHAGAIACAERVLAIAPKDSSAETMARFKLAQLGGEDIATIPHAAITRLYTGMAGTFDTHLVQRLGYRIPTLVIDELRDWLTRFPGTHGKPPSVCDLGCGTGLFGQEVRRYAGRLIGVDLSASMLARAAAHGCYDELIESALEAFLTRATESFDLVTATDVLIYVGRLEELFARVAARLSPGGQFAFSIESPTDLDTDFTLLPSGRFAHHPRYIERLAADSGFISVKCLPTDIRNENGAPISGFVFVFEAGGGK